MYNPSIVSHQLLISHGRYHGQWDITSGITHGIADGITDGITNGIQLQYILRVKKKMLYFSEKLKETSNPQRGVLQIFPTNAGG